MSTTTNSKAYPWALTGIFAAFHFVLSVIPYSVLGTGGGFITWGMVSAPIVGFLLGPFYGVVSTGIGSFLMILIFPENAAFSFLTPLSPILSALVAGSVRKGETTLIPLIYLLTLIGYIVSPVGAYAYQFVWLHLIMCIASFIFVVPRVAKVFQKEIQFSKERNYVLGIIVVWFVSFIAVLMDNMLGSMIFAYWAVAAGWFPLNELVIIFQSMAFVYPFERIIASIIVAVAIFAVGNTLAATYFDLPSSPISKREMRELTPEEIDQDTYDS